MEESGPGQDNEVLFDLEGLPDDVAMAVLGHCTHWRVLSSAGARQASTSLSARHLLILLKSCKACELCHHALETA